MWVSIAFLVAGLTVGVLLTRRFATTRLVPVVQSNDNQTAVITNDASLAAILDSLPMGIVVIDRSGREIMRNISASSVTGARHADVLVEVAVERLLATARRGIESREDLQLAGPPQRTLEVHGIPIENNGAVAVIVDITERRRLDQVRTDFVANVSHELKTPIGAISVLAETLEGETQDELVLRLAGRMVMEAHRMSRTIDDLLELSRIELDGEIETKRLDINDVVKEAVDQVLPIALKRGVPLEIVGIAEPTMVNGDFSQLVSAVSNLVENAVKYSDEGKRVEVHTSVENDRAIVEVTDHGIGIPAESLGRVFERFYRVDRARGRRTGGTGLGLSIVRNVATNHGGEVNVRSREGEGSSFSLILPSADRVIWQITSSESDDIHVNK